MKKLLAFVFLLVLKNILAEQKCPADRCDSDKCTIADGCHCSGSEPPLEIAKRPQIVYLTFDDAFTAQAEEQFYRSLFDGTFTNPNGCAIRATHFITMSYTDYSLVNQYWHKGHEIAAHSITHRNNLTYWQTMSVEEWKTEMTGVRRQIGQFANIPPCEVKGNRAPFLQGGGDTMFQMMEENNFLYDSSWPTRQYGYIDAEYAMFPYTLDYKSKQDCPIDPCPKCSHPGIWEQLMIDLEDEWFGSNPACPECGNVCSMLDGCVIPEDETPEHVFNMLMRNFNRTYRGEEDELGIFREGTRAPWGVYMHAAWFFGQPWHYEGYKMFIAEITNNDNYPDVYIVPIEAGLKWMNAPMDSELLMNLGKKDSSPFGCESIEADPQTGIYAGNPCGSGKLCGPYKVHKPDDNINGEERYMTICNYAPDGNGQYQRSECPEAADDDGFDGYYPWLDDICGGVEPCLDCVPTH